MIDEVFKKTLLTLIRTAGQFIKSEKGTIDRQDIDTKSHNSFVTYVDKKTEEMLVEGLSQLIPDSGFIAEEDTAGENNSPWRWIIDPLDGTTNFINNIYPVSVSVALQYNNKTIAGIVYEIGQDELFYAFENEPAMLNQKPIQVSPTDKLANSFVATGFPYYDFIRIDKFMQTLAHLMKNTTGVRRLGSAATDLAYVACGRYDAFFEYSLSPWDVAAGAFIVQQAGGKVADFSRGNNYLFGKEIVATNKQLSNEFMNLICEKMTAEQKQ
ncbi:MAG: inositol monophosphatase family protein [Salinivirgaceae bacterium]|jgi:myo-inositol-1(or 4)-monophosphatase|nr:inositol monophosphatase family protein [Salinivirgaceae bacterium]